MRSRTELVYYVVIGICSLTIYITLHPLHSILRWLAGKRKCDVCGRWESYEKVPYDVIGWRVCGPCRAESFTKALNTFNKARNAYKGEKDTK